MHFVYKTDNLFQGIRISYGNSSVTKGFHFFKTYLNSWRFVSSKCTIQSHIIIFQSFLTSFVIFHALLIILTYKTLKLKCMSNELWKGWKLARYHHFIHIACARKLRGLRQKLDALFVYKTDNLFQSIRISSGNSSVTTGFHFFKLICTPDFLCVQNSTFKATSWFSILSDFICYFSCIY